MCVFVCIGKEKLDVPSAEHVRIVLECDGTQIEDGDYFQTLAENTVLLLLRHNERWFPSGVDAIKAGSWTEANSSDNGNLEHALSGVRICILILIYAVYVI